MIIFYLMAFSFFVFADGAIITNNCATVSLTQEELKTLKDVAGSLKTFLNRNLDEDQKSIRKGLEKNNPSLSRRTELLNEPVTEEVLLNQQMVLHQEMKEMVTEMKQLILGHKLSLNAESKIKDSDSLDDQAKNDEKKDSTMKSLDSRGDTNIDVIENFSIGKNTIYTPTDTALRPGDCSELLVAGHTESGVYKIYPFICSCTKPVKVFCDMETDGGGWTIFLSRMNTSKQVNFTRNWEDYKNGFGTAEKEYWLGNEALHKMTTAKNYILRMEVKDGFGREIWGEWNSFSVNSEGDKYRLLVTAYNAKSTAFDGFRDIHNDQFSTFDVDNDKWIAASCSQKFKGGWWYNNCLLSNPTGIYGEQSAKGIEIEPWSRSDKTKRHANWLHLKIRPKVCSYQINTSQLNKHNCDLN